MSTELTVKSDVTNDGKPILSLSIPYRIETVIKGTTDFLFHRWSCEGIDIESYVYRCDDNTIGIPGEYLRGSIINAAKFRQDPRSPRKSAQDLFKAGIVSLTDLASLGKISWDKLHQCRVVIQKNAITRTRPCFIKGWEATFIMMVLLPEYIPIEIFTSTLNDAGRLIGIGDFRPTYGRFSVMSVKFLTDDTN
jgi:hypothetical protein